MPQLRQNPGQIACKLFVRVRTPDVSRLFQSLETDGDEVLRPHHCRSSRLLYPVCLSLGWSRGRAPGLQSGLESGLQAACTQACPDTSCHGTTRGNRQQEQERGLCFAKGPYLEASLGSVQKALLPAAMSHWQMFLDCPSRTRSRRTSVPLRHLPQRCYHRGPETPPNTA